MVRISYLEIYNEVGYDLLDSANSAENSPNHAEDAEPLRRIGGVVEESDGSVWVRGLSSHVAATEEQARGHARDVPVLARYLGRDLSITGGGISAISRRSGCGGLRAMRSHRASTNGRRAHL